MGEAYVDLQYRGLPLGNRARISQFEAHNAYVELPAPMPVGTAITLNVEAAGAPISAQVVEIVEQTAGSERPPGMKVKAVLDAEAKRAWWREASGNPAVLDGAPQIVEEKAEAKLDAKPPVVEIKPSTTDVMNVAEPEPIAPEAPKVAEVAAQAEPAVEAEKDAGATEVMAAMSESAADLAIVQPVSEDDNTSVTSSAPIEAASDEVSGVVEAPETVEAADAPEAPEAPTASDAAPKGRGKRKKPNRR